MSKSVCLTCAQFRASVADVGTKSMLLAGVIGLAGLTGAEPPKPPALFPLADVRPGLVGTTLTVLKGTKVEPVNTEIVGLVKDALGPGRHIILGRLDDEKTRLTFAVHGMSGSPLYIDGKLVGSAWLLPDQFRHFIRATGLPPRAAVRAVTLNPAESLGLADKLGVIAPGRLADLVAWDNSLAVRRVWFGGREIAAPLEVGS